MKIEETNKLKTMDIKDEFYRWDKLKKEEKKTLALKILEEIDNAYLFDRNGMPVRKLTFVPAIQEAGIMAYADMERFIDDYNRHLLAHPMVIIKRKHEEKQ